MDSIFPSQNPDQPVSPPLSPLPTPNDKLEIENRLGDYFVFLRRLISRSPIGKFLSKPHWVKLILSFLSVKPCSDLEVFLKLDDEDDEKRERDVCSQKSYSSDMDSAGTSVKFDQQTDDPPGTPITENNMKPHFSSFGTNGLEMSKNILFTPGLRPRLLAVQLLETLLGNVPKESSDLQEQVRQ